MTPHAGRMWALALAILQGAAASNALAASNEPLARSLDAVQVTANRRPEALSKAPRATVVFEPEAARVDPAQTVVEQLRGLPGVFVQQTTPGQGNAIVRGLKGSEVLHMVDGMRMNTAIFRNAPNNYIGLIDPLAVERVEVVRGPASVLYGSDAMGGVVHVITRGVDLDAGPGTEYQLQGGMASGDLSWIGGASAQTRSDRAGLQVGVFRQDVGERRSGDGERLPFSAFSAHGGELATASRFGDWELGVRLSRYEQPSTPRHDALVAGFGRSAPDNAMFRYEPNRRDAASMVLRSEARVGFWDSVDLALGWQEMVDGRRTRDLGSEETVRERNVSRLWNGSMVFGRSVGSGVLTVGADAYHDRIASSRLSSVAQQEPQPRTPRFADGARMRALGVFANHEWWLGERFELVFGARYSRFDITLPESGSAPGAHLRPHDLTGGIGFSLLLTDALQLLGNLGRGFRAPNVFDLGNLGPRPGGRFNQPNPALEPEQVVTTDLGLRFGNARTSAEVFAFASWYDDRIASVLTGMQTEAGEDIVQSRNIASARFRGIEAAVQHALGADTLLHATLNYTWGENAIERGTEPADRVPPLNGVLGLRHRFGPAWTVDLRAWAAGEQDRLSASDRGDPRISPSGTPGFAAVGVSFVREISRRGTVALSVDNVFDRSYREHGSGLDATGVDFSIGFDWRF